MTDPYEQFPREILTDGKVECETIEVEGGLAIMGIFPYDPYQEDHALIIPSSFNERSVVALNALICSSREVDECDYRDWTIRRIVIPDTVRSIERKFWANCTVPIEVVPNNPYFNSIDGVLFDKNLTTLFRFPSQIDLPSYKIPDSVRIIESEAFDACTSLKAVVIPERVQSIGENAFYGCSFKEVVIPNSVQRIGKGAFWYCSSLKKAVVPGSVQAIEEGAFSDCLSLKTVVILEGVQSIDEQAFFRCSSLKKAVVPSSVQRIGKEAFDARPVTLEVNKGSYAEKWAEENGVNYKVIG